MSEHPRHRLCEVLGAETSHQLLIGTAKTISLQGKTPARSITHDQKKRERILKTPRIYGNSFFYFTRRANFLGSYTDIWGLDEGHVLPEKGLE
jgi:hypothetical protein